MSRITFHIMLCILILIAFLVGPLRTVDTNTTLYVKSGGMGDCSSWADACDLQDALGMVESGDQVWVAEGIYYPGIGAMDTFQLKDGVALYGGFPEGGGNWDQRDWIIYPTILSGDIDKNDITTDGVVTDTVNIIGKNANHVVTSKLLNQAILDGFIITAGNANGGVYADYVGGGMYKDGSTVTLTNITFSGNLASWYGGAMYNHDGSATLTGITFYCNHAGGGGGIYNEDGSITLTNVTFTGNQANFDGGGLFNYGEVTLTDVSFTSNQVQDGGGGMFNGHDGSAILKGVTFSRNSAIYGGGGMLNGEGSIWLTDVIFSGNSVTAGYSWGGGLLNAGGTATLRGVSFSGNMAYYMGGSLHNTGIIRLEDIIFSNSHAMTGGGISNWGTAVLNNVTFSGNSSNSGGGIANSGPATLTNVTFSGNQADMGGGGIYNFASSPALTNVTFFNSGGGIYNRGYEVSSGGHPILINSVLWGNSPDQIYPDTISSVTVTYSDVQGGWDGEGNIDLNPLLGPLANNGGFTLTHALGVGSPAIDAGSPATCPGIDQRGFLRPFDGDGNGTAVCDMGAFEYGSFPYVVTAWLYLPMSMK